MADTEQAMTPREAADWVDAYEKRAGERPGGFGSMFGGPWGRALRLLIDHARASDHDTDQAERDVYVRGYDAGVDACNREWHAALSDKEMP